jgi:hypothetical protein
VSNPNGAKGSRWELDLRRTLGAFFGGRYGLKPFKPHAEGHDDAGDIQGLSPFVAQAKAYANIAAGIREGIEGAERQRLIAGEPYGVAFVKRPRKSVGEGYAVMTVETWARVLLRLARAEDMLSHVSPPACRDVLDIAERDLSKPFPTAASLK